MNFDENLCNLKFYRKTKLKTKNVYKCKTCFRVFTVDDELPRMRHSKKLIFDIVKDVESGRKKSVKKLVITVQNVLEEKGIKISRTTIYKWVKKFGKEVIVRPK